jgi:hypothetical protein
MMSTSGCFAEAKHQGTRVTRQVTATALTMLGQGTVSTLSRLSALIAVPISIAASETLLGATAVSDVSVAPCASESLVTASPMTVAADTATAPIEPGDIDASIDDAPVARAASVTMRRRSKPVAVAAAGGPLLTNLKQQSMVGKVAASRQPRVPFQEIGNF